jgi:hypothetical protein
MAYKAKTQRTNKIEPSVLTMAFVLPAGVGVSTVDLSQCASLVNRRFYRQGINWAVAGFKVISPTGATGALTVAQLPNTWTMANSWEKGMRTWTKMNNEALAESESVRPRFLDFKIYADAAHHQLGYGANLLPIDLNGLVAAPGEWEPSKVVIPLTDPAGPITIGETVSRELVAVGGNYPGNSPVTGLNALSLIEGYASSRALPNIADPNTPDDAFDSSGGTPENWMQAIFNDGVEQSSEVIEDMITENNIAPYPFENDGVNLDTMYPGGANQLATLQYHDSALISGTTIGGITRLKGGNFPCGLIRVSSNIDAANTVLVIDLIPGSHRGYLCETMTEM